MTDDVNEFTTIEKRRLAELEAENRQMKVKLEAAEQDADRLAQAGQALVDGFRCYLVANNCGPSVQMVNCQNSMLHEIHLHNVRKEGEK
jgi:hypothetical protein